MKNLFLFLSMLMTSSVYAQTSSSSVGSSGLVVTPPSGSSSAPLSGNPDLKVKKWNLLLSSQVDTSEKVVKDSSQAGYDFTNFVGGSYSLNADDKVYAKHYFSYAIKPNETSKGDSLDAVLQYSTKTRGLLGSDAISPLLWYYAPTSDASRDIRSNGQLRLDAEVMWTLTPRWKISYYFNPRQSFVPESTAMKDGAEVNYFSKTSLVQQANLYYYFNDDIQAYIYGGALNRWHSTKGTNDEEAIISAMGSIMQFGPININPEISNTLKTRMNSKSTNNTRLWQGDDITYTFIVGVAL